MRQNIWIWNHYATNMFFDQAGRHYSFAENLIKKGYNPTIFCASTNHFSDTHIDTKGSEYSVDSVNNIPFVFINTPNYKGNGKKRIVNMFSFFRELLKTSKEYAKLYGNPDVIIASSVHPLTLVAGINAAKKFGIPCICEVRDLWPESIVAYGSLRRNSIIARLLYQGEKWIYKSADKIVFTMEGGKDYIVDQKWDTESGGPIYLSKVQHINNGVDLKKFNYNKKIHIVYDEDLDNPDTFKVIYTGSIRRVNNVRSIIDAAIEVQKLEYEDVKFIIYGDGNDREYLEKYCTENKICNVVFKGFIEKKKIPYILSKSDLNIIHFEQNKIKKYGASLNKLFEYFASGKPILSDCRFGYELIEKYGAGVVVDNADAKLLAKKIYEIKNMNEDEYLTLCNNALRAADDYDFMNLTNRLINVIEGVNQYE